ncbi:hypothetical protein J4409_02875 [Candidatus Woesearchaeota archaeon]|nr:hypothetical protein [Candidatus Woesearchaeota archaeon]
MDKDKNGTVQDAVKKYMRHEVTKVLEKPTKPDVKIEELVDACYECIQSGIRLERDKAYEKGKLDCREEMKIGYETLLENAKKKACQDQDKFSEEMEKFKKYEENMKYEIMEKERGAHRIGVMHGRLEIIAEGKKDILREALDMLPEIEHAAYTLSDAKQRDTLYEFIKKLRGLYPTEDKKDDK